MKPDAEITRVTSVRGKFSDKWVVFGIWYGQERPVFESPDAFVAVTWARTNGWS